MKVIATLNFKGGVGKTTTTWLLARYLADFRDKKVLVIDADPQMSLTTAVNMLSSGDFDYRFQKWVEDAGSRGGRLIDLLKQYAKDKNAPLAVDSTLLYLVKQSLQLIPSVEELYWYELEAPPAEALRDFTAALVKAFQETPGIADFDYCLVDCPPAFNSLSFSVVWASDLVLVPINPDVFASRGLMIMLRGLRPRLQRLPAFVVFMNRGKTFRGGLTKESQRFLTEANLVAGSESGQGVVVRVLNDFFIPERKGIKDSLAGKRLAPDLETYFAELWDRIAKITKW